MTSKKETEIQVLKIETGEVRFCVLGTTPMIMNRMSEKARFQLLAPAGKKNAAEKAATMKHDPMAEFRASPYTDDDDDAPTFLTHLATAFKGALKCAALDIPGANKSQIGRLSWVNGERVAVYGVPQIMMSVVRSADINKTPDIRSRVIIPQWACTVSITFVKPILNEQMVCNLFAAAGIMQGVSDWRPGKGSGTYGQFELVGEEDPRYLHVIKRGGRAAQIAGMDDPTPYDRETEEMLAWYEVESKRRGFKAVA